MEFKKPYPKTANNASIKFSKAVSNATKLRMTMPAFSHQSTIEETEELRKAYLEIINSNDWKTQMENAAIMITQNLMQDLKETPITNIDFTIACDTKLYEFNSMNNKFIMIGRKPGCDIMFRETSGSSRLHAMVMPLPQFGIYLVIDMGGLFGIITEKRSNSKWCTASVPKNRNIIVLDWNEIAILKLGIEKIAINPKECVVCFEKARTTTYDCGHYLTCDFCTLKINACPVCRKQITSIKKGYNLQTKN